MSKNSVVLQNLLEHLPVSTFDRAVKKHNGNKNVRKFFCMDLLKTLIVAQVSEIMSVRDIESGFNAHADELYHAGLKPIRKSTFCESLNERPSEPFEELFNELVKRVLAINGKVKKEFGFELKIIDSTLISFGYKNCDWAAYRATKGGFKIHAKIDGDSYMPEAITITPASVPDVKELIKLGITNGTVYTFDRGYFDYGKLNEINSKIAFFVTRSKSNSKFREIEKTETKNETGVLSDARVKLREKKSSEKYPGELRVVRYHDSEYDRTYSFVTNNFELSAQQIADIYKARWRIEIFFKWIKQNLNIKTFYATTENAIRTQVFVAFITFLLLALCKYHHNINQTMHRIVSILRTTLFKRCTIADLFSPPKPKIPSTQIMLWDLG